jgi:hypothetical protein
MSSDDGIHIVKTRQGYQVRHWVGESDGRPLATYATLEEAIKRGQAERTEYGLSFELDEDAAPP